MLFWVAAQVVKRQFNWYNESLWMRQGNIVSHLLFCVNQDQSLGGSDDSANIYSEYWSWQRINCVPTGG